MCDLIEARFGKRLHAATVAHLRANGFSRQKARPSHPRKDAKAQERFQKEGSPTP